MKGFQAIMFLIVMSVAVTILFVQEIQAAPSTVTGNIQVQGQYQVVMNEDETLEYNVDGFFAVTRDGIDSVGTITATMTITEPDWEPALSQTVWNNVQNNENYDFTVRLTIPNGSMPQEQNTYTLELVFQNGLNQEVGRDSASFNVIIESVIPATDDDDDTSDDDIISPVEDESFPLWPIIVAVVVIGLLILAIWAKRNIEVVREDDGSRRVMFREKDSGHILGRKKQPPPELDL